MLNHPGRVGAIGVVSPASIGIGGGGGGGYDSSAAALIAAFSTPATSARMSAINSLIVALKSAGVWTKLDILYVLAAHDAQAGRLNWKVPASFALVEVNSPTFTTDQGYAGNGTTSYLNTQFTPSTNGVNLTQNSATIGVWSRTAAAQGASTFGNATGTGSLLVAPRITGDNFNYRVNQTTTAATANTDGSGHYAASRSASNATQGYKNGATAGSAGSVASAALPSVALNIGRVASGFSDAQVAAAYAGGNLTSTEHANLHSALNAYMTAVGAA